jgi:hypothetical protein
MLQQAAQNASSLDSRDDGALQLLAHSGQYETMHGVVIVKHTKKREL